jgi:flagellar export protein FliJ
MAVSRALRRLLRIRDLEEEQGKIALENALGELNRLENALTATTARDHRGRMLVESSAHSGQLADRIAGIEEVRIAKRHAELLGPRIENKAEEVIERRQAYLEKRVERRQAETLISETEARDAVETNRRSQQGIDDWYRNRLHRNTAEENDRISTAAVPPSEPV